MLAVSGMMRVHPLRYKHDCSWCGPAVHPACTGVVRSLGERRVNEPRRSLFLQNGTAVPPNRPTVDWLVETFGPVRAFELCMQLGGIRHYVPHTPSKSGRSLLSQTLTEDELRVFAELWAGDFIKFPLGRRLCIDVLHWVYRSTNSETARLLHITDDTVVKHRSRHPRPAWLKPDTIPRQAGDRMFVREREATVRSIRERLGLSKEDLRTYGTLRP